MYDDEEAQDVVDARPTQPPPDSASRCGLSIPWAVVLIGLVVSAVMMAAVAVSTVPLSMATGR